MSIFRRLSVLLAKIESTYGVDPLPSASTDAVLCTNPTISVDGTILTRDNERASFSPQQHVIGRKLSTLSFEAEMKGNPPGTTISSARPIEIDDVLRACGMSVSYPGGNRVDYKPRSDGFESATFKLHLGDEDGTNGIVHEINGAFGNFEMTAEAGNYARGSFNFTGLYVEPSNAALPTPTYEATTPPIFESAGLSLHGVSTLRVQQVTMNMNNAISERPSANSPSGLYGVMITGRAPESVVNPEQVIESTHPFYSRWASASAARLYFTIGSTALNRVRFDAPKVQYKQLPWGEREGIRTYEIPLNLAETSGDDEYTLSFL